MHESLITYINKYATTPLTASETELIKRTFIPKKIKKKDFYLKEGEICKYTAFIVRGAMRQYSVDPKGTEHIIGLMVENWWAIDRESNLTLSPSIYNIDAWEDTDLLIISKDDLLNLVNPIPAINEMARKLDENYAVASQKRMNATISLSAEQRYSDLAATYPEFLQRFPQYLIASYLGITKETLSRVRSNKHHL